MKHWLCIFLLTTSLAAASCRAPGPACSDGIDDGDETDIDCGGSCGPCGDGRACVTGHDCQSGTCAGYRCVPGGDGGAGMPDGAVACVPLALVSVSTAGGPGNGPSSAPMTSADGRFVVFVSTASNRVPGDTNGLSDAFLRDTLLGTTTRISLSSAGTQANADVTEVAISLDGSTAAFVSTASNLAEGANGKPQVFVRDLATGTTTIASLSSTGMPQSNPELYTPGLSGDGRYVVFSTRAALVPQDTNGEFDIYVRDRVLGTTTPASVSSAGEFGIGGNGPCFGYTGANAGSPTISADGRYVGFNSPVINLVPGDTNGCGDTFIRDMLLGATVRIDLSSTGAQTQGKDAHSWSPMLSADVRFAAFESWAPNLVPDDTNGAPDVFVRDLQRGLTTRVSVSSARAQGNGASKGRSLSADARYLAFQSDASNLVDGDTNQATDVFLVDLATQAVTRASGRADGSQAPGASTNPALANDGGSLVFQSDAALVAADGNTVTDVYQRRSCP